MKYRLLFLVLLSIPGSYSAGQQADASPPGDPAPDVAGSCEQLVSQEPGHDLLLKLCEFARNYRRQLPDFIAQQTITAHDVTSSTVLTEQVVFRHGRESYLLLTINGKPVAPNEPWPDKVRFITAGEFGSLLVNLFLVPGATEFKLRRTAMLRDVRVTVYEFHVPEKKNSFWTLSDREGFTLNPELRGELWLDEATGHPLREQMETVRLPNDWPAKSFQTITDYAMTPLGEVGTYLLPVNSETTICLRNVRYSCTSNTLVFHDYRKFGTSTRVVEATEEP